MNQNSQIIDRRPELEQMVQDLLGEANRQGASASEAAVSFNTGLDVSVRKGDVETIEHTQDQGLGVTVYFGQRKGSASTSDFSPRAIRETVEAACNIARYTNEDACAGLAEADRMARDLPDLDLFHPWDTDVDGAIELGKECENAALERDPRLSNSDGAGVSSHQGLQIYGNSHGFIGALPASRHSLSCSVIGQQADSMQRDYWYSVARRPSVWRSGLAVSGASGRRTRVAGSRTSSSSRACEGSCSRSGKGV